MAPQLASGGIASIPSLVGKREVEVSRDSVHADGGIATGRIDFRGRT